MAEHTRERIIADLILGNHQEVEMDTAFCNTLLARSRDQIAARPRVTRRRRWGLSLAAAAALVIGAAGIRQALVRPPEGPFVAVVEVRGDVTDAKGAAVALGEKLSVGARVKTAEGARVTLVTRRGSQFTLAGDTSLKLASASRAVLESGRLYCRSRGGEIEEIEASPGTIRLLGTTLDAAMESGDSVVVTVVDGKVRLSNSRGEAEVSAGNRSLLVASLRPDSGQPVNVREATAWYYGRGDIVSDFGDIAYVVARKDVEGLASQVWAMDQTGQHKRRLKTYLGWGTAPGPWLPGQQWLLFNVYSILWTQPDFEARRAHTGAGHPILATDQAWLLSAATGHDVALRLPSGYDPLYMDVSPDGSRLAFCGRYRPDPNTREGTGGGVWCFSLTTGEIKKLLDGWIKTPVAWAPDSRHLVASTGEGYGSNYPLVIADADTGEVTDLGLQGAGGSFSADGARVAYCGDFQSAGSYYRGVLSSGRIMVVDLRTQAAKGITPPGEGAVEPRWSPDGRRIAYWVSYDEVVNPDEGPVIPAYGLFVAAADGSGSAKVYQEKVRLQAFAWMPTGDALYVSTDKGVRIISADGSGVVAELGGTAEDSVLLQQESAQTEAALDKVREAVFQYAVGNVRRFEGKPREAQAAFQAASDTFSGLAWEYPLAGFSIDQLMLYADKAAEMAAVPRSEMLSKSCEERLRYLEILLLQYAAARNAFPPDLAGLERHSLDTSWGINWFSNKDTAWVRMIFHCPADGQYEYVAPLGDPKVGDEIAKCRAHPDRTIAWTEEMAEQLQWRQEAQARRSGSKTEQ